MSGALISQTDPIAVLGILKNLKSRPLQKLKISGESLFNDGAEVVVSISIFEIINVCIENVTALQIGCLFFKEAGGGFLFGGLLG